jgi:hypothetical protein
MDFRFYHTGLDAADSSSPPTYPCSSTQTFTARHPAPRYATPEPRHEPDIAAQTLLTTPSPSAAAPCLATPTPPQTIADTAARPLRIRSSPARLTVRHNLPMPDTATELLRGSHGG